MGGELWFVYVLFFIFLIWAPILKMLDKKGLGALIIILMVLNCVVPSDFMDGIFLYPKFIHSSIFFVTGYWLKDMNREFLANKQKFCIATVLFVIFCIILIQSIHIPYVWGYVLAFIGCWFIWSLSFQLLKVNSISQALSFCSKNSLAFYWLNGFALVPARMLIVKMLHIESTPVIAISIFLICVACETIAILILRKIPYVRTIVGIA